MNTVTKRQYRELSDMTKLKISQSMKGRTKSDTHREAISNGLKAYWQGVPSRPTSTPTEPTKPTSPTSQSDKTCQNGTPQSINRHDKI